MPTPESTLSSSDPPDPPPIATRTPNTSPTPMDDDNMAVSARTRASTRTSASTATTTTFPFATTSLSSQDIHTFNSSTSSLDPPHQPPLQRQVYTYQLPVRMNGGKIVYITKTYTRPARADPSANLPEEAPPKRPLIKRIIRFIKYGPVD